MEIFLKLKVKLQMLKIKSIASPILVVALSLQLFSCGYLIHPERRGQKSGQVDWAIAGLDAIGLLFFVIPGLVAFGVDIYSGTIYMSNNGRGFSEADLDNMQAIKIDPKNINSQTIAAAIQANTGLVVDLNSSSLRIYRDKEMREELANR